MPTLTIPTPSQARSKQRICEGFLHIYEIERYRLEVEHSDGLISEAELKQQLNVIAIDEERIRQDLESAQVIERTSSAA